MTTSEAMVRMRIETERDQVVADGSESRHHASNASRTRARLGRAWCLVAHRTRQRPGLRRRDHSDGAGPCNPDHRHGARCRLWRGEAHEGTLPIAERVPSESMSQRTCSQRRGELGPLSSSDCHRLAASPTTASTGRSCRWCSSTSRIRRYCSASWRGWSERRVLGAGHEPSDLHRSRFGPIADADGEVLWRSGRYFERGYTDEPAGAE